MHAPDDDEMLHNKSATDFVHNLQLRPAPNETHRCVIYSTVAVIRCCAFAEDKILIFLIIVHSMVVVRNTHKHTHKHSDDQMVRQASGRNGKWLFQVEVIQF